MRSNKAHSTEKRNESGPAAGIIASLILILLFGPSSKAEADKPHDHADIQAAAEAQARTAGAAPGGHVDVIANTIDARVRLSACDQALQTSIPYGNKSASRVTVEVRCASPKPWKIYVPVRRAIFRNVIVATHPLTRGSILAPDDIILAESDVSLLPRGYTLKKKNVLGHKLRRAIKTGDRITPGLLETLAMVRRGQKVSLEARSGGLTVRMAGIAKSDGILGEVIEFENQSSKRPIQAIVRSPQSAEILMQ